MDLTADERAAAQAQTDAARKDMWSGIGSIASGLGGMSDIRLKENITEIGVSPSGIPIYTFNYKGNKKSWSGTMAQDLIELGMHDAVIVNEDDYYMVDYSKIDINMLALN